jgi:hypothetical protein
MAAANPGAHRADGRKCSGKALLFAKTTPQTVENKKITVVDIVSTTVTDLVAEAGLEPATSGL